MGGMKKRLLSAVLSAVFALTGTTTVFAEDTSTEKENVTLTLWYWQNSIQDELLEKVSEAFPGVTIDAQKFAADDIEEKINTTMQVVENFRIFLRWTTGSQTCFSIRTVLSTCMMRLVMQRI
jgi:ABC-type glycerol-3-phosphate transport system substrate-binding protein